MTMERIPAVKWAHRSISEIKEILRQREREMEGEEGHASSGLGPVQERWEIKSIIQKQYETVLRKSQV